MLKWTSMSPASSLHSRPLLDLPDSIYTQTSVGVSYLSPPNINSWLFCLSCSPFASLSAGLAAFLHKLKPLHNLSLLFPRTDPSLRSAPAAHHSFLHDLFWFCSCPSCTWRPVEATPAYLSSGMLLRQEKEQSLDAQDTSHKWKVSECYIPHDSIYLSVAKLQNYRDKRLET